MRRFAFFAFGKKDLGNVTFIVGGRARRKNTTKKSHFCKQERRLIKWEKKQSVHSRCGGAGSLGSGSGLILYEQQYKKRVFVRHNFSSTSLRARYQAKILPPPRPVTRTQFFLHLSLLPRHNSSSTSLRPRYQDKQNKRLRAQNNKMPSVKRVN